MSLVPLILFAACFVALPHAVLLGLPIAGWLLRLGKFRLLPMTVAGAAVGAIPAVIWRTSSWNAAQVTIADHAAFGAFAAGLGAIGSAAFLFTYLGVSPNHSFKPTPLRGAAKFKR